MDWLKDINVLIFDMDGTLYQDYSFMGRYITKMMAGRHTEREIEEAVAFAYDLLEGKKEIRMGFMYDPESLVFYSQQNLEASASFDWNGRELELQEAAGRPLTYIGDPWGIAQLVAVKNRIPAETALQAFNEVRSEMLTEATCIVRHTGLLEAIRSLGGKRLILMTNSPLPTGQEFVEFLGVSDLFEEIHFDGRKPDGITKLVERLLAEGHEPREILSVGDHPWNDLYPVRKAGGHTCLISQYEHADTTEWSVSVRTLDELADVLKRLAGKTHPAERKEEMYG